MGIICGCLPMLAPVWLFIASGKMLPASLRAILSHVGSSLSHGSDSTQPQDRESRKDALPPGACKQHTSSQNSKTDLVSQNAQESWIHFSASRDEHDSIFMGDVPNDRIAMRYTLEQYSESGQGKAGNGV